MANQKTELPIFEIGANISLWTAGVLYALYQFYKSSIVLNDYEDIYNDFGPGWNILEKRKDISDEEWETILQILKHLFPWLLIHIACTEILKLIKANNLRLQIFQIAISFIFLFIYMNIFIACILLIQIIFFHLFSRFRSVLMLWICCFFSLTIITWYKLIDVEWLGINEMQHITSIMAVFWINLRCLSFCLDCMKCKDKRTLIDLLSFSFYLPTLYTGPFITFEEYKMCLNTNNTSLYDKLVNLLRNLLRILFWIVFTECALHFIYINAVGYQIELVEGFEPWAMYGYGYAMGQFFHLKYVIMYGVSTCFAGFEGAVVPKSPKCIGRIHLYSDMWKYFDQGLYKFLLRYIYLPTLRNKKLQNRIFSSFLCFTFVYIWHGLQSYILIWTILNFLGVTIENIFKTIYKNLNLQLSPSMERRMGALLAAPLLAISAMTNFYFFAGTAIGNTFFYKFFTSTLKTNFILILLLYCCCQTSIEVKEWERKAAKTI